MKAFLTVPALMVFAAFMLPTTATLSAADQKLVPIPLELPKPMFVGTPTPRKVERLDKPTGTARSYVELGPFAQWVQIDLGAAHNIYAVVLWHFHKQPRVYYDVVVQIADDADFTKNVTTVFNNDIDNSLGFGKGEDWHYVETNEGKLIDCKGVKGRYVRSYSAGNTSNDLNHWIEIEVYGKPAK